MKNNKKIIAAAMLAAVIGLTGCNTEREHPPVYSDDFDFASYENGAPNTSDGSSADSPGVQPSGSASQARGTYMSLTGDGDIEINRNVKLGNTPMGKEGTWTIFVYLCGSDLESGDNGGYATLDIEEMLNASTGENVRFVIQTGGASRWYNNMVNSSELGRFEICNGQIKKVDKQPDASMGASDTLANFLKWGVSNYPAAHMGVVLWNHGGGSISGVCSDETWKRDILRLTEIDAAFAAASEVMTDKFEFVGFDACLMATVECANILSPYADYMYGSEELEAGYGWDYAAIGNYLGKNPKANGEELGRVVCDSFFDMLKKINADDKGTLSVTDLSKMDKLIKSYHAYTKELDSAVKDINVFTLVVRGICASDTFGNNNKKSGYTNMVDLGGIVAAGEQHSNNATQVLNAIDEAVVYNKKGEMHPNACGLSTYYPLSYKGQNEIEIFSDIALTPYYLSFVTRTAYGLAHNGDMSGYVEQEIVDEWGDSWSSEETSESTDNYWDSLANAQVTGNSQQFQFEMEPTISDGWVFKPLWNEDTRKEGIYFGFKLTEQSENNLVDVRINEWMVTPDGKYLIDLGEGQYPDVGKKYGYGYAAGLGRGITSSLYNADRRSLLWGVGENTQPIAMYVLEGNKFGNSDYYQIVPVSINGVDAYLHYKNNKLDGVWYGLDENGIAGRDLGQLKDDDVVVPRYNAISLETGEKTTWYGVPVNIKSGRKNSRYNNATHYISFELFDTFGNSYETDSVRYEIADGKLVNYKMVDKNMLGQAE